MRPIPTSLLILLTLGSGAVAGAALDEYLDLHQWRYSWQLRRAQALQYHPAKMDPKQFALDSAREEAWRAAQQARWRPREVGRLQALSNCVVMFEIRDTSYQHMQLFESQAWDRSQTGTVIAHGYAFKPDGFRRGDTARVVL